MEMEVSLPLLSESFVSLVSGKARQGPQITRIKNHATLHQPWAWEEEKSQSRFSLKESPEEWFDEILSTVNSEDDLKAKAKAAFPFLSCERKNETWKGKDVYGYPKAWNKGKEGSESDLPWWLNKEERRCLGWVLWFRLPFLPLFHLSHVVAWDGISNEGTYQQSRYSGAIHGR